MKHLDIIKEKNGMIDHTKHELEAAMTGLQYMVEVLREMGSTDIEKLDSLEKAQKAALAFAGGYTETLAKFGSGNLDDEIPF